MKLLFLGSQGSGKSTQAKLLAGKLDLPYIEMGQLFRDKSKSQSQGGADIKRALDVGNLVPDHLATKTLHERLLQPDCKRGYVLDGYPRNYAQLEGLDQDIDRVFYIKVSDQEAIRRLLARARTDDNLKVLTRRLEIYHKETEPLLGYFRERGILEEIDGERPVEMIAKEISQKIANENYR
ncbi:hypothetical protein A3D81_02595 [Candidatus Curtissbacteria bacterium RIFCSPHIGHO2_02_FULL_40_17]|uniref:Adenylate kinase n=4 Tax=Candidatus Curtissiibacteriota TaxID=1752717 RepID=A0A1F5GJG3_9BACT|nr:MAG: hypothetical protein A2693_01890 [Candidatus Curtissbacteria bacterium RIFCSPHIGHO2_01_FULL_40_12]OGD91965.1 MAG: hypothetical protein A3D81_02595 [Candidatus Curtissbacteria bacterium RIFCSPHIGHO2_02_FULL_40_17]OGE05216.1 MAG: hypothetical protein A3F45_01955 [Candidatus Curtissbacteria bacterium RIFCSPHIGHO2_12_FULL_41_17]OGE08154.1 MAG: hypothetical protein A3I53_00455 [Candidatus Curtissbacteria bacterium RIFCSPLOWO2_02_FULL_40_13b]